MIRAWPVALIDDENVGDLEQAGLDGRTSSPMSGTSTTTVVSARRATSTSDCPAPTVSISTGS